MPFHSIKNDTFVLPVWADKRIIKNRVLLNCASIYTHEAFSVGNVVAIDTDVEVARVSAREVTSHDFKRDFLRAASADKLFSLRSGRNSG